MRLYIFGLIFLLATTALAQTTLQQRVKAVKDPESVLEVATLLLEAGRYGEAKTLLKKSRLRAKNKSEHDFLLAKLSFESKNQHKMKMACRKLEEEYPKSHLSQLCFGDLWLVFKRTARSEELFADIVDKDVRAQLGLAKTAELKGAFEQARKLYEVAAENGAGYRAYVGIGIIEDSRRHRSQAQAAFEKALKLEPDSALANYHLGRVHGKKSVAEGYLKNAVVLNPEWADALGALGDNLLAQKQYKSALKAFQQAVALEPERSTFLYGIGQTYFQMGQSDKADEYLNKALEKLPNYAEATLMLARVEAQNGNSFKAGQLAQKAAGLNPDSISLNLEVAKFFLEMKRHTRANSYLLKVISLEPRHSEAQVLLGNIACERRMFDEGKAYYDAALKGDLADMSVSDVEKKKHACH